MVAGLLDYMKMVYCPIAFWITYFTNKGSERSIKLLTYEDKIDMSKLPAFLSLLAFIYFLERAPGIAAFLLVFSIVLFMNAHQQKSMIKDIEGTIIELSQKLESSKNNAPADSGPITLKEIKSTIGYFGNSIFTMLIVSLIGYFAMNMALLLFAFIVVTLSFKGLPVLLIPLSIGGICAFIYAFKYNEMKTPTNLANAIKNHEKLMNATKPLQYIVKYFD